MAQWVDVMHAPGKYRVSNEGQIMGRGGRLLKHGTHRDGYQQVKLHWGNVPSHQYVHRLVAEAFCPRPVDCDEVDHIDGDKTNNRASNLRWVTRHQNMQAAQALGLLKQPDNSGEKNGMAKLNRDAVTKIRDRLDRGFTKTEVANEFGVTRRCIGMIADGLRWNK